MPTPLFAFRLAKPEQRKLAEMARIYGSPNPSAFVREMVGAICSGDMGTVNGFLGRLGEKLTGQLTLEFQRKALAELQATREAAPRPAKPRKRRRPRGRT